MNEPLIVAVAQPRCTGRDVTANVKAHAELIRQAEARVVIFPELSLSGYEMDAAAIGADDPRLTPLIEACAQTGTTALVGAPVHGAGGSAHIATLAVNASGAKIAYRKMWLSSEESERFTAGAEPAVLVVDGWRLGLAICKDTSVARHSADTAALGIDVYAASTLMHDHEVEIQDERARRIATRHHVWVAVASFAGPTGSGYDKAAGRSGIWSPAGDLLAHAGPEPGGLVRAGLPVRATRTTS